jgi:predicted nucleic acid-binding protein
MELKYLWDTNTVIYYLQNHFPPAQELLMDGIINNYKPAISVITEIELLCWRAATDQDLLILKRFIADATVFELDQNIISIRKQFNLKLPDAVIAATALKNGFTLISHNYKDFKKIEELQLLDPFEIN